MRTMSSSLIYFVIFFIVLFSPIVKGEGDVNKNVKSVTLGIVVFPPLVIKDNETGKCSGEVVEMSDVLLKQLGYDMKIECIPPARLYERVRKGEIDLTVNVKGTAALDDNAMFIEKPVTFLTLIRLANTTRLDEKSIAGIRGYDYIGERNRLEEQGYVFFDMPSSIDSIRLFLFDRTANLITYERPFYHFLGDRKTDSDTALITLKRNIPTFFAVSLNSPHKKDLYNKLTEFSRSFNESTILEYTKN
ncbi:hypothetical protein [Alteromonas sp. MB-3u-76]|nr:hypothetical protein [Alteromonas sp. MB-3u-76]